jgi:3'(2'), 5'-bisphosphate nucleotidase
LKTPVNLNPLLEIAVEAAIEAGNKTLEYYHKNVDVILKVDKSFLTIADLESNKIINKHLKVTEMPVLSEENDIVPFCERKKWQRYWLVDPLDGTKEFVKNTPEYSVNIAFIEDCSPVLGVVYFPAMGILYYGVRNSGSCKASVNDFVSFSTIKKKSTSLPTYNNLHNKPVILVSKSHLCEETKLLTNKIRSTIGECIVEAFGSSLKFCLLADGCADIYPRIGATMEWDTAASQAIVEFSGCRIISLPDKLTLKYNKENLLNPSFIVYRKEMEQVLQGII